MQVRAARHEKAGNFGQACIDHPSGSQNETGVKARETLHRSDMALTETWLPVVWTLLVCWLFSYGRKGYFVVVLAADPKWT